MCSAPVLREAHHSSCELFGVLHLYNHTLCRFRDPDSKRENTPTAKEKKSLFHCKLCMLFGHFREYLWWGITMLAVEVGSDFLERKLRGIYLKCRWPTLISCGSSMPNFNGDWKSVVHLHQSHMTSRTSNGAWGTRMGSEKRLWWYHLL